MPYQIAVLIWVLLIVAVLFSVITTLALFSVSSDSADGKLALAGVGFTFLTAIIGWGIWAIYPLTGIG